MGAALEGPKRTCTLSVTREWGEDQARGVSWPLEKAELEMGHAQAKSLLAYECDNHIINLEQKPALIYFNCIRI